MVDLNNINIKITTSAYKKIKLLIQNDKKLKFRIYITGGGCNGFQYNFKIDTIINKNDIVINKSITILIDCISIQYINGGKIDYQENLEGSKFIVSNPNASTTCSCGSSFGI